MNDQTTDLDLTDEDILTYTLSDEALEAAAGMERGDVGLSGATLHSRNACCPIGTIVLC